MSYYICPICHKKYSIKDALYSHMEREHKADLEGLPAAQVYFNWKNRKDFGNRFGRSIVSGKPTKFNLTTERYEKFASDEEKEQYRRTFLERMRSKYGKDSLLDEPDHQKMMLANRSISGVYEWEDGTKTVYTGSYEKAFLTHLEAAFGWSDPSDVMAPCPTSFHYSFGGIDHFHIPDFEIGSLNLIVNIKSTGNEENLRGVAISQAEDASVINGCSSHYVKIYDNDFRYFDQTIEYLRNTDHPERVVYIGSVKK